MRLHTLVVSKRIDGIHETGKDERMRSETFSKENMKREKI